MCSSKCAAKGIASKLAGIDPRYPILSSSDLTVASPPPTSRILWASSRGIAPAHTPEAIMEIGNRAPSSFVQLITPTGNSVSIRLSSSTLSISTPASTPKMPSYRPPLGWVSRCDPTHVGGARLRPGRTANVLPMASTVTLQPSERVVSTNQSRACLSASDSERRDMPVSVPRDPQREPVPQRHVACSSSVMRVWLARSWLMNGRSSLGLGGEKEEAIVRPWLILKRSPCPRCRRGGKHRTRDVILNGEVGMGGTMYNTEEARNEDCGQKRENPRVKPPTVRITPPMQRRECPWQRIRTACMHCASEALQAQPKVPYSRYPCKVRFV